MYLHPGPELRRIYFINRSSCIIFPSSFVVDPPLLRFICVLPKTQPRDTLTNLIPPPLTYKPTQPRCNAATVSALSPAVARTHWTSSRRRHDRITLPGPLNLTARLSFGSRHPQSSRRTHVSHWETTLLLSLQDCLCSPQDQSHQPPSSTTLVVETLDSPDSAAGIPCESPSPSLKTAQFPGAAFFSSFSLSCEPTEQVGLSLSRTSSPASHRPFQNACPRLRRPQGLPSQR